MCIKIRALPWSMVLRPFGAINVNYGVVSATFKVVF